MPLTLDGAQAGDAAARGAQLAVILELAAGMLEPEREHGAVRLVDLVVQLLLIEPAEVFRILACH